MALSKSAPLEIIPSLRLDGDLITGQDVIVSGKYAGHMTIQGELVILGTGEISGKLSAQALIIDIGGKMEAEITVGQKPPEKVARGGGADAKP